MHCDVEYLLFKSACCAFVCWRLVTCMCIYGTSRHLDILQLHLDDELQCACKNWQPDWPYVRGRCPCGTDVHVTALWLLNNLATFDITTLPLLRIITLRCGRLVMRSACARRQHLGLFYGTLDTGWCDASGGSVCEALFPSSDSLLPPVLPWVWLKHSVCFHLLCYHGHDTILVLAIDMQCAQNCNTPEQQMIDL